MPRGSFGNPYDLGELIDESTGEMISLAGWRKVQQRKSLLAEQSDELRETLIQAGVEVDCQNSSDIYFTGAITGLEYRQKQRRNINFLPDIAQRNRRQQQMSFAKFAARREYLRYLVVTAGDRIEAFAHEDDIRQRRRDLLRRISKLAAYARERFGIKIYLAALECPRDPETGTYHLHANVIYDSPKLSKKDWSGWLRSMRKRLKFHVEDNGRLENLDEVIKYITKPEQLTGMEASEARWLFDQWYRGKVIVAYGDYKDYLASIKQRRLKIVQRSDGELVFLKKEVAQRRTLEERLADLSEKLGREVDRGELAEVEAAARSDEMENVILTITQPTTMFGPFKEPIIVHMGLNHMPKGEDSQRRYSDYLWARSRALDAWERNTDMAPDDARRMAEQLKAGENVVPLVIRRQKSAEPSSYRVHNNTLTVHFSEPKAENSWTGITQSELEGSLSEQAERYLRVFETEYQEKHDPWFWKNGRNRSVFAPDGIEF